MENRDDIALSWETAEVESGKAAAVWWDVNPASLIKAGA